jgi:hypothetical protein
MNRFARICIAFGVAAAASTAFAAEPAKPQATLMSEAEMDSVTAGNILTVVVTDSLNNWDLDIAIKLQANVAANVNAAVALVGAATAEQGILSQTQITGNLQ